MIAVYLILFAAVIVGAFVWLYKARKYCLQVEAHRTDVYSRGDEDGPFYAACRKPDCDWFSATVPQYFVAEALGIAHVKCEEAAASELYDQRTDETALRAMSIDELEDLYRDDHTPAEVRERIDQLLDDRAQRRDWERSR